MRPKSIIMFERLYFASLAATVLDAVWSFDAMKAEFGADPAIAETGFAGGFTMAIWAFSFAFSLLLWFFIAKRASNFSKWLLVIVTVFGLLMFAANPAEMLATSNPATLVATILSIAAMVFLFRADAREWFSAWKVGAAEARARGVGIT